MTRRARTLIGSPCWADLWTSDVDGSRRFYSELFGWQSGDPMPEFGGYFNFTRDGEPIAGGMGDMGDRPATNTWRVYFATSDIAKTLDVAANAGGQVLFPPMAVHDLGSQAGILDPLGAFAGFWQPDTFGGFPAVLEPGTPSWFELHTRDHARAVDFYETVLGATARAMGDTDDFRYSTLSTASGEDALVGIMDASKWLPEGEAPTWSVYWEVEDPAATLEVAERLGGRVVQACEETPWGRLATAADPQGAVFKLRSTWRA